MQSSSYLLLPLLLLSSAAAAPPIGSTANYLNQLIGGDTFKDLIHSDEEVSKLLHRGSYAEQAGSYQQKLLKLLHDRKSAYFIIDIILTPLFNFNV